METFTQVPNQLLEHSMRVRFTSTQLAIMLAVIRKTHGYHREDAAVSLLDFERMTGLSRNNLWKQLKSLREMGVLSRVQAGTSENGKSKWRISPSSEWKVSARQHTVCQPTDGVSGRRQSDGGQTDQSPRKQTVQYSRRRTHINKGSNKRKRKGSSPNEVDERFRPLIDFFLDRFRSDRGVDLVPDKTDFAAVKKLLVTTRDKPEFTLDYLKASARLFITSRDKFYRGQGHPFRYWATNVNGFIPEKTHGKSQPSFEGTPWAGMPTYVPKR